MYAHLHLQTFGKELLAIYISRRYDLRFSTHTALQKAKVHASVEAVVPGMNKAEQLNHPVNHTMYVNHTLRSPLATTPPTTPCT